MPDIAELAGWVTRCALLDRALYRQVETDEGATRDLVLLVVAGGAAGALGITFRPALLEGGSIASGLGLGTVIQFVAAWSVWVGVAYGTLRVLGSPAAYHAAVLRGLALAQTPALVLVVAMAPILGLPVRIITLVWSAVCTYVALQELRGATQVPVTAAAFTGGLAALATTVALGALGVEPGLDGR